MPKAPVVAPERIIEAVLSRKNDVLLENGHIPGPSNKIWDQISNSLGSQLQPKYIYTFVKGNRRNVLNLLQPESSLEATELQISDLSDVESESSGLQIGHIEFNITLSSQEWQAVSPSVVSYKCSEKGNPQRTTRNYVVLQKGWTDLLAQHFWEQTSLPCAVSFQPCKIHPDSSKSYATFLGTCTDCKSVFKGVLPDAPMDGARVLIKVEYTGNFVAQHLGKKKRLLRGESRANAVHKMCVENMSASMFQRSEANRLMEFEDCEPGHLPSLNALRVAKSRANKLLTRADDPVIAISLAKSESNFEGIIKDIGYDRFFVHYWGGTQIHVYRKYCKRVPHPKVSIDATGGVVRRLKRSSGMSGNIFLYEITVSDGGQYPVANMLSERHDNNSIHHWLVEWTRDGAPIPHEAVCDMSLALMSAIVRAFTQFTALEDYLNECFKIVFGQETSLPKCYVRNDVAHFVKLVTCLKPLQNVGHRTKNFYVRSLALVILATDMEEVRKILFAIFTVAYSETEGADIATGQITPCEVQKKFLQGKIAGKKLPEELESAMESPYEDPDDPPIQCDEEQQEEDQPQGFQSWAFRIAAECKQKVAGREGDHGNQQHLEALVPCVLRLLKLLPCWSGVMRGSFKYGSVTASSAAVESSFNDLKNRIFSKSLPKRVDLFLGNHIAALEGSMKLAAAAQQNRPPSVVEQHILNEEDAAVENWRGLGISDSRGPAKRMAPSRCIACAENNLPQGAYKCSRCSKSVHPWDGCSVSINPNDEGYGEQRMCVQCVDEIANENPVAASPAFPKSKRARHSYLEPQSEMAIMNLSSRGNARPIGLLKNGDGSALKPVKIGAHGYILTNTCAFDSFLQVVCTAYCDSDRYMEFVAEGAESSTFLRLVQSMCNNGVSTSTYRTRTLILKELFAPVELPSKILKVSCESTASDMVSKMLRSFPSVVSMTNPCDLSHSGTGSGSDETGAIIIPAQLERPDDMTGLQGIIEEYLQDSFVPCVNKNAEGEQCDRIRKVSKSVDRKLHVVIEVAHFSYDADAVAQSLHMDVQLSEIPSRLTLNGKNYSLRGVIASRKEKVRHFSYVTHYVAYCKRDNDKWEKYDDTKATKETCPSNTKVNCEICFFTI